MREDLNYIEDGYTEQGYIEPQRGLHGSLRFTYRPLIPEDRSRVMRQMEACKRPEEQDVFVARTVAKQLVSWSLETQAGKGIDTSEGAVRRLRPALFYRLWGIILGTEPTDMDPEWEQADKAEHIETLTEVTEGPPPIVAQEAREKN